MNDTTPEIEARIRDLLKQRSGSDRIRMTCEMFDLARALIVAQITTECPDITPAELRVRIFEQTHGGDFDADSRARIIARLRA